MGTVRLYAGGFLSGWRKCVGVAEDAYGRSDPLRHQNGPHERNRAGAADAQAHRKEKLVFISGFKDFDYAQKALEYGVFRYCIKPVTFREMQKTIAAIRETIERERGVHLPADSAHSGEANSHSIADVKIDRIRRYVQDHYAGVTLRQLAEFMQMNTTYLSYYFKEKTGQKLFDYITEVRLNAGLEILKTDSYLNVAEVAQKVGYTNAISFSRSFKKQFGVSPSQVRRNFDSTEEKK